MMKKLLPLFTLLLSLLGCKTENIHLLPNILWITCEDISPYLGCYGDPLATTPNLDRFATEGIRYTSAWANAPVCAPARFTILTGVLASSAGTQNMRSNYRIPEEWKTYPEYLREAGYYCTNNGKQDYNFEGAKDFWDESSAKAHYKNRKPGQPFFAIFNFTISHESKIHEYDPAGLIHDPAKINLPPYHPDRPEIRNDWAKLYDNITKMDEQAGEILDELERNGLKDSTIVFFYSDHGGVLPRSKRFLYRTGTQVPMIIRFPKMYHHLSPGEPGTTTNRLVSFVDLAPTLLSMINVPAPDQMDGLPFLGSYTTPEPDAVYLFRNRMDERLDFSRSVVSSRYHYIINYMPHRPHGQYISYLWRAASTRIWEEAYLKGECNIDQSRFWETKPAEELYDMDLDPWEVKNLASNPQFQRILEDMRGKFGQRVLYYRDAGFIPEGMIDQLAGESTQYEYTHSEFYPIGDIMELASKAASGDPKNLSVFIQTLSDQHPIKRYWAATGCLILGEKAAAAIPALERSLSDDYPDVSIVAAEALYHLGEKSAAMEALKKSLAFSSSKTVLSALNVVELMPMIDQKLFFPEIKRVEEEETDEYVLRVANHLLLHTEKK